MSLNATFSLTPLEPRKFVYDYANSRYEHNAYIIHYGAYLGLGGLSLEGCYNANEVYLECNNVGHPFPDPFPSDFYERALVRLRFTTDAPIDKQHLILFHVRCDHKIGIYLNGNLVREEDCDGDETIAILVDSPGPDVYDSFYVVPQYYAWIKGVDCYVI